MAIDKAKKSMTIEKTKKELEGCTLLAGINYKRLTVKQLQDFRRKLPETSRLMIVKNKLLGKAVEGTAFEAVAPALKGMNAWLFVHSEEIPPALKPYRDLQKELKLEDNDYTGAVFEGKFYPPADFKALETMPSRLEIYAKLLGTFQGPAQSLVGTLKAPSITLVMTLKAHVAKLEAEQGGAAS